MIQNLKEELKKLPDKPGVYIMRDADDTILYVGKAVNLSNRVRSYFRENIGRGPKIDKMVSLVERFEYIVTDSELEALVLENNLIKEHRPKYNTMLMDDKTYPYIKISVNEDFPRITIVRQMKRDKARYFGPFTNSSQVREVMGLLNKLYGLRRCNNMQTTSQAPSSPKIKNDIESSTAGSCLYYHIHQCSAPCINKITKEAYMDNVDKAIDFLSGNYAGVVKELKVKMESYSENLEFEKAAECRDLIESIKAVTQKQKIESSSLDDKDIIAIAREGEEAVVQVFFVRNGRMIGREHYYMQLGADEETLSEFVKQFYGGTSFIPKTIMLSEEISDIDIVTDFLSGKRGSKVHVLVPKIGQKERLVDLARENAMLVLTKDKNRIQNENKKTLGAVNEIEKLLGLRNISRMEAFDISNTSGFENVASMVVFESGKAKKSDYRKFKIKTVAGPDDYACMRETIYRRFTSRNKRFPDDKPVITLAGEERYLVDIPEKPLILMDGGRGQVNIALEVIDQLGINVPVAGMVKDDNHRTRGIYYNNVEQPIDTTSEGFKLITRIQDEAHRFAITYHRSLRRKDQVKSVLDDIPGVGPARRLAIMKAFASIDEVKDASISELIEKAGLPNNAAEAIYNFFRNKS